METIFFFIMFFLFPCLSIWFCVCLMRKHNLPSWIKTPVALNLMTIIPYFMVSLISIFAMDHPNNDVAAEIFCGLLGFYPIMAFVTSVISYVWYSKRPTKWSLLPIGFMCLWYMGIFLSFVIAIWG